ncbi:hypothetical protein tooticki91_gp010 [Flavobacterium phage vB_FspS_tooticki9-1]|uniref:Uncharacterized protein n=10 Tax=Muminvirus TaxID=2843426 RepID=A0A6B9LJ22_9CAUD|nr:hypothetical protein HWC87_gp16 [Flavobacterium phage vB_FspS_filifjonk9-1]YP_009855013.1 hypothetical protein HWC93_gp12 [Flavobacterium phage vB_FspS_mumin9-1]YP_009855081.1 hypothetical protein HWC94_gp13 [Flavobacterium phage vB_FspS_mymlan6-1]YP_009855496.1 hypothetical protein HWD00_gp10 [Flavobacterium phage vB_FspS_tooticki6-1]QHB39619.1 hypothetical protein mumin61_gp012 [Flavobacterium phage vB_FspS_mumin6-1]QHB39686.1 hypothetical protein mumin62_gp012 [Flavobacterium phage vB_Fs
MPNHKLLSAQLSKTLVIGCFYLFYKYFKNNCIFIW